MSDGVSFFLITDRLEWNTTTKQTTAEDTWHELSLPADNWVVVVYHSVSPLETITENIVLTKTKLHVHERKQGRINKKNAGEHGQLTGIR